MQKLVLMDTTYICGAFHPFSYQIFESYTHVTSDLLSFFGALLVRKKVSWMKNKHTHTHTHKMFKEKNAFTAGDISLNFS